MTLALIRESEFGTDTDPRQDAGRAVSAPDTERSVRPIDAYPDFDQLRTDAHTWRRANGAELDWEHQYENYLRYVDAFEGARLDDAESLDAGASGRLLARALVHFSDRVPAPDEWQELMTIHLVTGANVYDLALAWGVGWNPIRAPRPARHVQPSDAALFALIEQAGAAVAATARMLTDRAGLAVVDREEFTSLAAVFGMSLTGRCDCGHHIRGCTGCGRNCCFPDHDLRTWDPYRCHLRPFVDQAVRGTAQRRIMGGAFAAGMLFRSLERDGRLLCRTVECGRCDDCGRMFEGLHCPEPHPHRPGSIRREPRKNQLVRPADSTGGHLPLQRWWCAQCQHLYGAAGPRRDGVDACPRCSGTPDRRMTVWARVVSPVPVA